MKVVFDIECNSLTRPTKVHCIVCKELGCDRFWVFRNVTEDADAAQKFLEFTQSVECWVGHNVLGYDLPVLSDLIGFPIPDVATAVRDTFIVSRLVDYSRKGHSIEAYGQEFGLEKIDFNDFKQWSQELEDYCKRDVEIAERIYLKYQKYIEAPEHRPSIELEHRFQLIVNDLRNNGFQFNVTKAKKLLDNVTKELTILDTDIMAAFPPKLKLIKEITPKVTKHGTLSRSDFRWVVGGDLSDYNGGPFCRCEWVEFNPASHKQLIDVLHDAGWKPENKTATHIETERELNRLKYTRKGPSQFDLADQRSILVGKLDHLKKYGWSIDEKNLSTLPDSAPSAAKHLARRILLESRRRTLTEWLGLVSEDGRVHGDFQGIGAWTHRMAHRRPNTANITNEFDTDGKVVYLGKEFRQLWTAPRNRLLVGVDAEGIQLRIFAHYINDEEFTYALVSGKKSEKTDPHSLNQRILGSVCKSRQAAKRFIYALLLGAGTAKLSEILGCSDSETEEALDRLLQRYEGWARLKTQVFPADAKRGYFIGLDGRKVAIPGDTAGNRKHLCMSGYLQTGEAVCMKLATLEWYDRLRELEPEGLVWKLVNFVHDEWQTEVNNDMKLAIRVAEIQADALRVVGERLGLKCPLAGSFYNDDHKDYTVGKDWYQTH